MDIATEPYRVREGTPVDLSKWPTRVEPVYRSKRHYRQQMKARTQELARLQYNLYASNTYALLLIFQAMDAAGKDSAIRHVMSGINPQGCQVYSFSHPSTNELEHDFLWRSAQVLPERGRIGIFNRSYYEEVLIVRVHPEILQAQGLPDELVHDGSIWHGRFGSILNHETHLLRNGTKVVKFFLHVSPEEQRKRFLDRIDEPEKNWKFSMADIEERRFWPEYMRAYEQCLSATSTEEAPWYVVPADDKRTTRLIVSRIIVEALESLNVQPPEPGPERLRELQKIRKSLAKED